MSSALLKQAIALHRGGKLDAAEQIYRRVLAGEPGNSDVLHFLGLIAHQSGRHDEAAEHIRGAVALRPSALYWYNLGLCSWRETNGAPLRMPLHMPSL